MGRKALFIFIVSMLLVSMMVSVFLVTLNLTKAGSSDSNGDSNSWLMFHSDFHSDLNRTGYSTSTAPLTNQTAWISPTRQAA